MKLEKTEGRLKITRKEIPKVIAELRINGTPPCGQVGGIIFYKDRTCKIVGEYSILYFPKK